MIEISTALATVKAALDLARLGVEARDDAKAKHALSDLASALFDANISALALSERTRTLDSQLSQANEQLRELQERVRKRERYSLLECRSGAFVYAYKPVEGDPTPPHYLCQNCFDKGVTSVLRRISIEYRGPQLVCAESASHAIAVPSNSDVVRVPR